MRFFNICSIALSGLCLWLGGCAGAQRKHTISPVPCCTVADETSGLFLSGKNMLTGFMLIGPFPAVSSGSDLSVDSLHYAHLPDERNFKGEEKFPESVQAFVVEEDVKSIFCDLQPVFPVGKIAYAIACIESKTKRKDVTLHLGSSGYIKVWWNGTLVYTYDKAPRTGALDQGAAEHLTMKAGKNILLIKCVRTGEKWNLFCRFSQNGSPLMLKPSEPPAP